MLAAKKLSSGSLMHLLQDRIDAHLRAHKVHALRQIMATLTRYCRKITLHAQVTTAADLSPFCACCALYQDALSTHLDPHKALLGEYITCRTDNSSRPCSILRLLCGSLLLLLCCPFGSLLLLTLLVGQQAALVLSILLLPQLSIQLLQNTMLSIGAC